MQNIIHEGIRILMKFYFGNDIVFLLLEMAGEIVLLNITYRTHEKSMNFPPTMFSPTHSVPPLKQDHPIYIYC